MSVKFNGKHLSKFVKESEFEAIWPQVQAAHQLLEQRHNAYVVFFHQDELKLILFFLLHIFL